MLTNEPDWTLVTRAYMKLQGLANEHKEIERGLREARAKRKQASAVVRTERLRLEAKVVEEREMLVVLGGELAKLRAQYTNATGGVDTKVYGMARAERYPDMKRQYASACIRLYEATPEQRTEAYLRSGKATNPLAITRKLTETQSKNVSVNNDTPTPQPAAPAKTKPTPAERADAKAILADARRESRQILAAAKKEAKAILAEVNRINKEADLRVLELAHKKAADIIERVDMREARVNAIEKRLKEWFWNQTGRRSDHVIALTADNMKRLRSDLHPDRYPEELREKLNRALSLINANVLH